MCPHVAASAAPEKVTKCSCSISNSPAPLTQMDPNGFLVQLTPLIQLPLPRLVSTATEASRLEPLIGFEALLDHPPQAIS